VRKLASFDSTYRIRVGEYRVIFDIDDTARVVFVLQVIHQRDAYRR